MSGKLYLPRQTRDSDFRVSMNLKILRSQSLNSSGLAISHARLQCLTIPAKGSGKLQVDKAYIRVKINLHKSQFHYSSLRPTHTKMVRGGCRDFRWVDRNIGGSLVRPSY